MELYIHYPFCVQKCRYCDFLSAPSTPETRGAYLDALINEIHSEATNYKNEPVETIFIGGGTPSIMTAPELTRLMAAVHNHFNIIPQAEITMEANPGTLTKDLCSAITAGGINRLSLGLQSADNTELKLLGRIHTFEQFCESYEMAVNVGLGNINIDLMSALPGQTEASWERTLNKVLALKPQHISAYSLIIEEGTPFYDIYGKNGHKTSDIPPLPDEDTDRKMYEQTKAILAAHGFHRYEISNYALPGCECRHNIGYWQRKDYLGLGLGASSLIANTRFTNTSVLKDYLHHHRAPSIPATPGTPHPGTIHEAIAASPTHQQIHPLTIQEQIEEYMFLGLRLTQGITASDFQAAFGQSLTEVYGQVLQIHRQKGLLNYIEENGQLYLTAQGLNLSNYVLSDFLLS